MGLNGRLSLLANFSGTEDEESDGNVCMEDGEKTQTFKLLFLS